MAVKKGNVLIKLVSELGTGVFYVRNKTKSIAKKMEFRKYDPVARKHAVFKEKKING